MFKKLSRLSILSLLLLGAFTVVLPVHATTPTVNHNSSHTTTSTLTDTCTVTVDNINDVIVDMIQIGGNGETTWTATDSFLDTFVVSDTNSIGMHVFVGNASSTGSDTITVTVSPNTVTIASWCYDLTGVQGHGVFMANERAATGSVFTVNNQAIAFNSVVLVELQSSPLSSTFTAGSGYTVNSGCPINSTFLVSSCSEYGVIASNSTDCPITSSNTQTLNGVCVAFPPKLAPVTTTLTSTVTSTTTATSTTTSIITSTTTTSTTKLGIIMQTTTVSSGLPTGSLPTLTPVQKLIIVAAVVVGLAIAIILSTHSAKGRR